MSNVVNIADYADRWKTVFTSEDERTTLRVYRNTETGEIEVVQLNNDNESIATCLDETCVRILCDVLKDA